MAIIYDIHQHDLGMRTRTLSESEPLTGYPSIDKPWLKYYSDKAINMPLPKCTMFQYVYDNNKDYSADIALQYYGKRITYGQLFERIRCAASAFWAMGVRGGDIVTIMSMHTPETIYAIYALNYIGAVANMVYMTLAEKEILRTLESTESKMLLVLDAALDRILPIKDKLAVPVYTSGTTGAPKGVMLSNSEVNALAYQDINGIIGLRRNLVTLFILPPFIGYGYITIPDAVKKTEKRRAINNLAELLVTELSEHMLPRKIIVLDAMPITQSGKVDYRTLEEMANQDARHA